MVSTQIPEGITAALASHSIPYVTPDSLDYAAQQHQVMSRPAKPSLIARPHTPEHIAALVSACAAAGHGFTVRSGGHDLNGRCTVDGAVQIDVRDLNKVVVSEDQKTARVGGGATFLQVLGELEKYGLMAPVGSIGTVGYVGWSTFGGYGSYSSGCGLGMDGIVGARIVNSEGKIVDASERVLKAIRGGGVGNWGVVLDLEIKVYPCKEIQAGVLIFDSGDLKATAKEYFTNLTNLLETEPVPSQLGIQVIIMAPPGQGLTFMVSFLWNGPASDDSKAWQERVAALGPCVAQAVQTTTPLASLEQATVLGPSDAYGNVQTVSLSRLSAETITAITEVVATMPPESIGFSLHVLEPCSPSTQPREDSVFLVREPHYMAEILGSGTTPETAELCMRWAADAREKLSKVDSALEATYFPLTQEDLADPKKIWGRYFEELVSLKKEADPRGVFKHGLPLL